MSLFLDVLRKGKPKNMHGLHEMVLFSYANLFVVYDCINPSKAPTPQKSLKWVSPKTTRGSCHLVQLKIQHQHIHTAFVSMLWFQAIEPSTTCSSSCSYSNSSSNSSSQWSIVVNSTIARWKIPKKMNAFNNKITKLWCNEHYISYN